MANTTEAKQITVCLKKRHIGYKDTIIGQNCNFGSKLIVFLQAMKSLGGALYAILSSAAFGLVPLFSIPLLAAGLSSPQILFFRMVFAAAIIGMASKLIFGKSLGLPFGTLCRVAVLSTLYAATSLGLVESYKYIPSGVATTIHFLYPLVVTIIMALLFKVKTPKLILLAVVLSLAGVALLSCGDMGDANPSKGIALAGMTALTYASYITGVMKSRVSRMYSTVLTFYVLLFSAAIFFIFAVVSGGIVVPHSGDVWCNIMLLALIPTAISNLTLVLAIKRIGSVMTSILGSMEPLTAVMVGVLHFGEAFGLETFTGLVLAVAAVMIVITQSGRKS